MTRLFFAIDLPERLKAPIAPVVSSLSDLGRHVRPVGEGSLHATLLFLGEQPQSILPDLAETAKGAVAGARPCRLEIGPVGFFPRVSFLTLVGEIETLTVIASVLSDACANYLENPETRPFKAHVTLSRHKERISPGEKERIASLLSSFEGLSLTVDELILFESELTRSGAIYTPVGRFRFGG